MRTQFVAVALAGLALACASASAHDRYGPRGEERANEREIAYQKHLAAIRNRQETRAWERENRHQKHLEHVRKRITEREQDFAEDRPHRRHRDIYHRHRYYSHYRHYRHERHYSHYRDYVRHRDYGQNCDCLPDREFVYVRPVTSYVYDSSICVPSLF